MSASIVPVGHEFPVMRMRIVVSDSFAASGVCGTFPGTIYFDSNPRCPSVSPSPSAA